MKYYNKRRWILGISLALLVGLYLFRSMSFGIRVAGMILGLWIFYFFDHAFEIEFKERHYVYAFLLLFFGVILSPFYFLYPNYDKILHFLAPIIAGCLVFYIVNKQKISFQWKLLITFMFVISFITIQEVGEYLMDIVWDLKLQGVYLRDISGLEKFNLIQPKIDDTMIDLILGMLGSLTFVIGKASCYFYKRKCKRTIRK